MNAFDFGPDGYLYGPLSGDGTVVRIDVDAAVPTPDAVASGFSFPTAVKFNSLGELYAGDLTAGSVARVDIDTGDWETIAEIEGVIDNIAFSPED